MLRFCAAGLYGVAKDAPNPAARSTARSAAPTAPDGLRSSRRRGERPRALRVLRGASKTRVDPAIDQIYGEVDGEKNRRAHDRGTLHNRKVAAQHRLNGKTSHAGPRE